MAVRPVKLLDPEGLLEYAARALTTRGLSLGELRQRLERRASRKEDVAQVIARLKDAGILNDRRLADSIAGWRRDSQGLGKTRVLRDLMSRRIAPAVARQAVDAAYSGVDEVALIEQFLARKYRGKNLGSCCATPSNWLLPTASYAWPASARGTPFACSSAMLPRRSNWKGPKTTSLRGRTLNELRGRCGRPLATVSA